MLCITGINKHERDFVLQVRWREWDTFKILEIFWKFFGYFWEYFGNFLGGFFWRNFFGGIFREIFERIFLGGFFGRIFCEDFFWKTFFWRNYLVEINMQGIDVFIKILGSQCTRKKEFLILRSATQARCSSLTFYSNRFNHAVR